MSTGGWELVTTNAPAVVTKPLLDSVVVENGQSDRGFPYPADTDESDWTKVFGKMDYLLDQLITPKTSPWWWRR